jgi:hypothetical protein
MNHSIAYSDFSTLPESHNIQQESETYENIMAAIGDINFTLPQSRALRTEIVPHDTHCEMHIVHNETIIHTYFLHTSPNLLRRILTQITLGFVSTEKVEVIKTEIESKYTYGERIIL